MEQKLWITIEEGMGTDGEFFSNAHISRTAQEAGEYASSLIADMAETMDVYTEDFDPTATWEIGNQDWWYRVRVVEGGNNPYAPSKELTTSIQDLYDRCVYGFDDRLDQLDFATDASIVIKMLVKEFNIKVDY